MDLTAQACTPDGSQCSPLTQPIHLQQAQSFWDPQRSTWSGMRGPQLITYHFRDANGSFSTQNWSIPGYYGFWNTSVDLKVCGVSNPPDVIFKADGVTYNSTNGGVGGNYLFTLGEAHSVSIECRDKGDLSCADVIPGWPFIRLVPPLSPGQVLIDPDGFVFDGSLGLSFNPNHSPNHTLANAVVTAFVFDLQA